jgi:tRNA(fMet)-specific endonuclease VapC
MTTFLLDTNIIIDAVNGRHNRPLQLEDLMSRGVLLACTSINVTEMYMGMRPHEAAHTDRFLKELEFYPVTWEIAQLAGRLFYDWRQRGQTLALADVTIAAVCIARDLTLFTDNQKHFPMPELRLHPNPLL